MNDETNPNDDVADYDSSNATTHDEAADPTDLADAVAYKTYWLDHPAAIFVLISTIASILFGAALIPIEGVPWTVIASATAWIGINIGLCWLINRRQKSVAQNRPRQSVVSRPQWLEVLIRLRRNIAAMISVCLLVIMIILCFGQAALYRWETAEIVKAEKANKPHTPNAFVMTHLNPMRVDENAPFAAPTVNHWFGTDSLGRDLFARTLWGGQISFLVALVATLVSLIIGIAWGSTAAYVGGRVDHYMMRFVDILYGLPFMFLVILVLSLVNGLNTVSSQSRDVLAAIDAAPSAKAAEEIALEADIENVASIRMAVFLNDNLNPIVVMFLAIGMVSWLTMSRIVRGQVLSLKEREFVVAAQTIGAGPVRIIFRHLIPNLLGPVIVFATLTIPSVMLTEAFLSFLGLGIAQPDCSWGSLASEGLAGVNVIKPCWWLLVYPSLALALSLFSLNFLGDGLRDAVDPRRSGS